MSDAALNEEPLQKKSKLPLIMGLVLALLGGGGGFFATYSGMVASLLGTDSHAENDRQSSDDAHDSHENSGGHGPEITTAAMDVEFVALEPITINFGNTAQARHLRFSAQLEVPSSYASEVTQLEPRIIDVLNIYLRALAPHELEEPAALMRLRGQMLRRVQIVTGPGRVRNLLVMEFVFI